MAQKKKKSAQRAPRAAEPRMYGDGKPSQGATARRSPRRRRAVGDSRRRPARPHAPERGRLLPRVDRITDYSYVKHDLRRLGITAVGILGILVVLGVIALSRRSLRRVAEGPAH